jgi:hypothetical protein
MVKHTRIIFVLFSLLFLLNGCLVVGRRIFTYALLPSGKVELTIHYLDIGSAPTTNGLEPDTGFITNDKVGLNLEIYKDYEMLIRDYYVSNYFQKEYPTGKVISRKLIEENGKLNGEVKILFESLSLAGIKKQKKNLVFRSDSLCEFLSYTDSLVLPKERKYFSDATDTMNHEYYLFYFPKNAKEISIEMVPYFPYQNTVSLLETWKKFK